MTKHGVVFATTTGMHTGLTLDAKTFPWNAQRPITLDGEAAVQSVREFSADRDDNVWAKSEDSKQWIEVNTAQRTGKRVEAMPADTAARFQTLYQGSAESLRRDGNKVVRTYSVGDQTVSVELDGQGASDLDQVRAVLPLGTSMWVATPAGLWLIDQDNRRVLAIQNEQEFRVKSCEFRWADGDWHFINSDSQPPTVYRLRQSKWTPIEKGTEPWNKPRTFVMGDTLRVTQQPAEVRVELRGTDADRPWLPVAYDAKVGRPDFLCAVDAAYNSDLLHVRTPVGVVTWRISPDKVQCLGLRPGNVELRYRIDTQRAVVVTEGKESEQFDESRGWTKVEVPAESWSWRAFSPRWQVRTANQQTTMGVTASGGKWTNVALHNAGGFKFQHVTDLAQVDQGAVWLSTPDHVLRTSLTSESRLLPDQLFLNSDIDASAKQPTELLSDENNVYVAAGNRAYGWTPEAGWRTAPDDWLARRRQLLCRQADWEWNRDLSSVMSIRQLLAGRKPLVHQWNATTGRFAADTVDDVAISKDMAWLGSRRYLVQANIVGGETVGHVTLAGDHPTRLILNHESGDLWVSQDSQRIVGKLVKFDASQIELTPLKEADSTSILRADFHDAHWHIDRAAKLLTWHGLPSGIDQGRFLHDMRSSCLVADDAWWIATRAGVVRYAQQGPQLHVPEAIPLPPGSREALVTAVTATMVAVVDDRQMTHQYDRARAGGVKPTQVRIAGPTLIRRSGTGRES